VFEFQAARKESVCRRITIKKRSQAFERFAIQLSQLTQGAGCFGSISARQRVYELIGEFAFAWIRLAVILFQWQRGVAIWLGSLLDRWLWKLDGSPCHFSIMIGRTVTSTKKLNLDNRRQHLAWR
jgi:hypothetical protein